MLKLVLLQNGLSHVGNKNHGERIISLVLIFLHMNFHTESNEDDVVCYGSDLIDSADIYKAKDNLWRTAFPNVSTPKRVGTNAKLNYLKEIFDLFCKCDAKSAEISNSVINCPTDLTCVPASS